MRARIARQRLEQIVRGSDRFLRTSGLVLPAAAAEDPVPGSWGQLLAPEQLLRAPADRQLANRVLGAMEHRVRIELRLVDGRHRLGLLAHLLAIPVELGRVGRSWKHERDSHVMAMLLQLDASRLEEGAARGLRRAVRGLKRDPAIGEGRRDVEEGASAVLQRGQGSPVAADDTEEVDVEDPAKLV